MARRALGIGLRPASSRSPRPWYSMPRRCEVDHHRPGNVARGGVGDSRRPHGMSILTADLRGYRRRLMKSPWVAEAALPPDPALDGGGRSVEAERRWAAGSVGPSTGGHAPRSSTNSGRGPFDLPIIDGLIARQRPADHRRGARRSGLSRHPGGRQPKTVAAQGSGGDRRPRSARRGGAVAARRRAAAPRRRAVPGAAAVLCRSGSGAHQRVPEIDYATTWSTSGSTCGRQRSETPAACAAAIKHGGHSTTVRRRGREQSMTT